MVTITIEKSDIFFTVNFLEILECWSCNLSLCHKLALNVIAHKYYVPYKSNTLQKLLSLSINLNLLY